MKDITPVVRAAKRIETLLEAKFGAQGRGLHEKLSSVERQVPAELHKTIRYVATVRNKVVHEDDYELDDAQGFLHQAERVARALEDLQVEKLPTRLPGTPPAASSSGGTLIKLALAMSIGGFIAYQAYQTLKPRREPADEARTQTASIAPATRQTQKSGKDGDDAQTQTAARKTKRSGKDGGKEPTTDVLSGEVMERFAKGEHVALDSPLLKVEKITLAMAKDAFGDLKPRIQLKVRNTSTKTLSDATYEARLFIDSQPQAVIDERASTLTRNGLFLWFGDQGLKAGESTTVTPVLRNERDWVVPDILNARRWQLVIRNNGVTDGLKNSVDVKAAPFTVLPTRTPIYTAPTPSASPSKTGDTVDFVAALRDGVSAGAGNQALSLRNVKVKMGHDSFDRPQPIITLDMTNISERTLSDAVLQAQLYLDGQDKPVLKTSEKLGGGFSSAPGALFAHFGDRGLAPAQTRKVELRPDGMSSTWTSPDVLNAKSLLVLLRVAGTTDGLDKPYGGTAQQLP
ncbi:hypothetical protein JRI60_50140 [Archangium violaceum]|uniref:hypothetical protein n=1 Tax=Archangium violaceum TaxID=83451 RepID=UPI00194FD330|nr:hypothetical protein [Archangium violaceum]QRN97035.1 hypothetical protein JRI60_50140 [Archangium violaceum]